MTCPRCSIGDIAEDTGQCVLCGYEPRASVTVGREVVDEVQETVQREFEGQFRINVMLMHGTRSVVYVAHDVEHDRLVALKVIPVQRGLQPDLEQFKREIGVAMSLDHSHIVPILDYGATRALFWYTMEYVEGNSLDALLRDQSPLPLELVQKVFEQAASAADYMHRRGVTHGNVKPSNILVDATEKWVKISDPCVMNAFGRSPSVPGKPKMVGTPEYMAPEQFRVRAVGPSVDQYALAVTAFECLSGALPFVGDSVDELEQLHQTEPAPELIEIAQGTPRHVSDAIHRAMSKTAAGRFATVLDFVAMLRRDWGPGSTEGYLVQQGQPSSPSQVLTIDPRRRHMSVWRLVVGVAVLLAAGAVGYTQLGRPAGDDFVPQATTRSPSVDRDSRPVAPTPPPESSEHPVVDPPASPPPPVQAPASQQVTPAPAVSDPTPAPPAGPPGRLFISTTPWGQLYIDGELIGNTPKANLEISSGTHRIRVVRDGFESFDREVVVAPGQQVRLVGIVLQARSE